MQWNVRYHGSVDTSLFARRAKRFRLIRSVTISEKVQRFRALKGSKAGIPVLTAVDYPTTRLLDECGVPLILIGDSLGMVTLGYENTTHVTMTDMEHHIRAASRARPKALLVGDLPYQSYNT